VRVTALIEALRTNPPWTAWSLAHGARTSETMKKLGDDAASAFAQAGRASGISHVRWELAEATVEGLAGYLVAQYRDYREALFGFMFTSDLALVPTILAPRECARSLGLPEAFFEADVLRAALAQEAGTALSWDADGRAATALPGIAGTVTVQHATTRRWEQVSPPRWFRRAKWTSVEETHPAWLLDLRDADPTRPWSRVGHSPVD
jgi:hypothetical protein